MEFLIRNVESLSGSGGYWSLAWSGCLTALACWRLLNRSWPENNKRKQKQNDAYSDGVFKIITGQQASLSSVRCTVSAPFLIFIYLCFSFWGDGVFF